MLLFLLGGSICNITCQFAGLYSSHGMGILGVWGQGGVVWGFGFFFFVLTYQNRYLTSHYVYINKQQQRNTTKLFVRLGLTPTFKNRVMETPGVEELSELDYFFLYLFSVDFFLSNF